jgi:rhodanese-related sulfurtransferase
MRPWRIVAIVLTGVALGLLWNGLSGRGLALNGNAFIREGEAFEEIEAPAARARLDKGALFLDARPVDFYDMAHIPGALPLPEDDFERAFGRLETRLRSSLDVIVYCSGYGCEASHIVARKLRDLQVHAAVLHEGWPAWTEAGYPTRTGPNP